MSFYLRAARRLLLPAMASMIVAAWSQTGGLAAQEQHHDNHGMSHPGADLHFSHPLIAESASPDTKVRTDYLFRGVAGNDGDIAESTIRFEAEYAFHPSLSVELDLPYTIRDIKGSGSVSHLDQVAITLKFANFAFAEHGVLLGYGIEVGLPTGSDAGGIGSDHLVEFEPFFRGGYRRGPLEAAVSAGFGIPTNQRPAEEIEIELGYNLSLLYHIATWVQGLVELDAEAQLSGPGESETVVNLTPGFKVRPVARSSLLLGLGVGVPLSAARAFDGRLVLSVFYHFAAPGGSHH